MRCLKLAGRFVWVPFPGATRATGNSRSFCLRNVSVGVGDEVVS